MIRNFIRIQIWLSNNGSFHSWIVIELLPSFNNQLPWTLLWQNYRLVCSGFVCCFYLWYTILLISFFCGITIGLYAKKQRYKWIWWCPIIKHFLITIHCDWYPRTGNITLNRINQLDSLIQLGGWFGWLLLYLMYGTTSEFMYLH